MKISKVNHTRSGVGIREKQAKGMLYANPKRSQEDDIDLKAHVAELNKTSQRLYSFFNKARINELRNKDLKNRYNDIDRFSKELINLVVKKCAAEQQRALDSWINYHSNHKNDTEKYKSFYKIRESAIDDAVDGYLRNSLKKSVQPDNGSDKAHVPDLMKKLLKLGIQTEDGSRESLSAEEKEILLKVLNEDYKKEEMLKKVVHSIELQNVRIKCVEKDGKRLLALSNADHEQKKYIFLFLQKFAAADGEEEREKILKRMKRLILLYYRGKEKCDASLEAEIPAWSWGVFEADPAGNFDDRSYELINENCFLKERQANIKREDPKEAGRISKEIRQNQEEIKTRLKTKVMECYREAKRTEGISPEDDFWLRHIEKTAEKILLGKGKPDSVKLSTAYLCEHTYREWLSFIAMKYIDMGKGVYHFTAPQDLKKVIRGEEPIGEILPKYRNGISSFDYERIKAEETINRDLSLYISFAANNFSRSVLDDETRKTRMDDILSEKNEEIEKHASAGAGRNVFRYFGGRSSWKDGLAGISDIQLICALKEGLRTVRNQNFHYAGAAASQPEESDKILKELFLHEFQETGRVFCKKYYSNNTWMFYEEKEMEGLLDVLYAREPDRLAQVPSFQKIINKKKLDDVITKFVFGKSKKKLESGDNSLERMEKFRHTLFFLLKEIYYYGFLQESDLKERIIAEAEKGGHAGSQNEKKFSKEEKANQDFKKRLHTLEQDNPKITFGEICQQIMTDYNQQNQGRKVISDKKEQEKEKYKHFPMLLYAYIRNAFLAYLKEKECYRFLRGPQNKESMAKEITPDGFCASWQPHLYDGLKEKMDDHVLLSWHVTAHFLNQKQLNMLIGCIKNYNQYIRDIDRRSANTKNRRDGDTDEKIERYEEIISVLEFSKLFCGSVTNCFEDYFEDEEDYAEHLANYVDFELGGKKDSTALRDFCRSEVKAGGSAEKIGLYYDESNPIVNKNIIYADMYGNEKLFRNCFKMISREEIQTYYRQRNHLSEVFKNGGSRTLEEEKDLRRFQNMKNHIELTEIMTYSEMVNDFMGQLISWAYLRERDLMYYQLGFHYMRLFYSNQVSADSRLRQLKGEGIHIQDAAALYQIIAMYTYDLPVLTMDHQGERAVREKDASSNGKSIKLFCKYCGDKGEVYESGLCLFENVKTEHDEMVFLRNYIDHFKYYSLMNRSILELYSDVYDRFFNYDVKLKRSVTVIFQNILLRYFVKSDLKMESGSSKRYTRDGIIDDKKVKKRSARLSLKNSLESMEYQISKELQEKLKAEKSAKKQVKAILARDDNFLDQLEQILSYKE